MIVEEAVLQMRSDPSRDFWSYTTPARRRSMCFYRRKGRALRPHSTPRLNDSGGDHRPARRHADLAARGAFRPNGYEILDVLQTEAILPELKSRTKKEVLEELVAPVARLAKVDSESMVRVLLERERLGSTGIGGGIGIPHGKLKRIWTT